MDENVLLMAEALARSEVEEGVRRVVASLPKQPINFDGLCEDCGDKIPTPRIKFGATTCISCQTLREWRASLTRRP